MSGSLRILGFILVVGFTTVGCAGTAVAEEEDCPAASLVLTEQFHSATCLAGNDRVLVCTEHRAEKDFRESAFVLFEPDGATHRMVVSREGDTSLLELIEPSKSAIVSRADVHRRVIDLEGCSRPLQSVAIEHDGVHEVGKYAVTVGFGGDRDEFGSAKVAVATVDCGDGTNRAIFDGYADRLNIWTIGSRWVLAATWAESGHGLFARGWDVSSVDPSHLCDGTLAQ